MVAASERTIPDDRRWLAWLASPERGAVLVEVESKGATDIDLRVQLASRSLEASSHRGREQLLVLDPQGPLRVEVRGDPGSEFALRLVNLPAPPALPREGAPLALEAARAGCWTVSASDRAPRVAFLELSSGDADWRLYRDDGRLLAVGERRGSERAWLPPTGDALLVVLPRKGAVRGAVRYEVGSRFRSPLREYLAALGKTPEQKRVLATLAEHPDFLRIVSYLEGYPGGLPISLRAQPGLEINGVERFGAYRERVLTINPTIAPHKENPQELVDTVVHELIHAVLDVPRAPGFPFGPEVKDSLHDPKLRGYSSSSLRRGTVPPQIRSYLKQQYGPSASNPTRDFSDLNAGGQRLIVKLIRDNMQRTGQGAETLVFQNARAREARSTK